MEVHPSRVDDADTNSLHLASVGILRRKIRVGAFSAISLLGIQQAYTDPLTDLWHGVTKGAEGLGKGLQDFVGSLGTGTAQLIAGADQQVEKLGSDTFVTFTKGGQVVGELVQRVGGDTVLAAQGAGKSISVVVAKGGSDTVMNYTKVWKDIGEQAKRSFDDTVEAGEALLRYSQRTLDSKKVTFSNAEQRFREGKAVDAVWGMAVEPIQAEEENFFKATQESSVINQAASSAAATYGGPGGAAAYAAWQTYRATGDASAAFRSGVLAGITSANGPGEPLPKNAAFMDVVKRAASAGAAGGIAVAAQGGDEAAIKDGFLKAGGSVLIQAGRDRFSAYSPKGAAAVNFAECVSARDVDCLSKTTYYRDAKGKLIKDANGLASINPNKLDPKAYVGKWTGINLNAAQSKADKLVLSVSKLPGDNKIVLFNGQMIITTRLGQTSDIDYGNPQVVLTSIGSAPPFVFARFIGVKGGAAERAIDYDCQVGNQHKTIRTTYNGNACTSVYRRDNGSQQIVWETPSHANACAAAVAREVKRLSTKGIVCTPTKER
jgi:hypothetical protein